jgi:hypothetical protein
VSSKGQVEEGQGLDPGEAQTCALTPTE